MNSKKIWSLVLLFAISFSVMHDYAFSILDKHSSVETYVSSFSSTSLDKPLDILCDIHFEYHTSYIFTQNKIFVEHIKENSVFVYDKIFYSLNYFNFFKPPIV